MSISVSIKTLDGLATVTVGIPLRGTLDIYDRQMSGDLMAKINNKYISISKIVPDPTTTTTTITQSASVSEPEEIKPETSRKISSINKKENK